MTKRDQVMLSVVGALVVLAAGWFLLAAPKRAEQRSLDTQLAAAQAQYDQLAAQVAQYRTAREELRRSARSLVKAGRALPTAVAMPAVLRQLERTARESSVQMSTLTTTGQPSGVTTLPGVNKLDLDLVFQGRFVELQRFLANLQRFVRVSSDQVSSTGRLLTLNSLKLAPGTAGLPRLDATVSASIYVLQPQALLSGQGATGTTPASPGVAAPGVTAPATAAPATSAPASSPAPAATAQVTP